MAYDDDQDLALMDPERRALLAQRPPNFQGTAFSDSVPSDVPVAPPVSTGPVTGAAGSEPPPVVTKPSAIQGSMAAGQTTQVGEPPPVATAPPEGPYARRERTMLEAGPPKYHGVNRFLDVLGRVTGPGRAIEEQGGFGTLGYASRLGAAQAGAKEERAGEFEKARTEEQGAKATQEKAKAEALLHPPPKPVTPKEEVWKTVPNVVGPGGKILQEEQNSGQIRWAPGIEGVGPLKPPAAVREPIRVMGDKTYEKQQDGSWKEIGPAPPRAEPGNYLPVNDENGATTGWIDPKSHRFVGVGEISGVTPQIAPGGAIPPKPGQMQQSRAAQASVIDRAANNLIDTITQHKEKVGNVEAFLKSVFLGTPIADPELAGVATELGSFAALQPAMHGFRGTDALREFEKLIGGVPKNADALIASIKSIQRTAGAVNPRIAEKPAAKTEEKGKIQFTPLPQ